MAAGAAVATAALVMQQASGGVQCAGEDAKALCARLSKGLPLVRDLTSREEAMKVLELATEILNSKVPLEEIKKVAFKDPKRTPAILLSAVGSAESKLKLQKCGPHHMTCIFAMYGEQNRLRTKAEHENGQDLLRLKTAQLEWLFDGEKEKTWELIAVDDGCPNDSIGLARKIKQEAGLKNVKLLNLQEAVDQNLDFFTQRGLKSTKDSRKGGAILYGLWYAAKNAKVDGKAGVFSKGTPQLVMYTDSDLSTDMSLCGLLSAGILTDGCCMSMGARYGMPETFLVKDKCALGHPESHYDQPNMMKIVFRHYQRVRLLPMLKGIYDTQCAFKCFKVEDLPAIIDQVQSMGPDFDMELLLCALQYYQKKGIRQWTLCKVYPTLFTEDFAESNFMASSSDPDKPYKTYLDMVKAINSMHERYIDPKSAEASNAKELVAFCKALDFAGYKKMITTLEAELGPTLFDYDFGLENLKVAAGMKKAK